MSVRCQAWIRWLADEDELPADAMAKMWPPHVPEQPVDLATEEEEMSRLVGAMTANGIAQMIRRRGREVWIKALHAHRFRDSFAHQ